MEFEFVVHHYAEQVFYECQDWSEKNSDRLLPNVSDVLEASNSAFLKELMDSNAGQSGKNIAKGFLRELETLVEGNLMKCQSR